MVRLYQCDGKQLSSLSTLARLAWRNNIRRIVAALCESSPKADFAAVHGLQSAMYPSAKAMDTGTSQRTVKQDISVNHTVRIDKPTELLGRHGILSFDHQLLQWTSWSGRI